MSALPYLADVLQQHMALLARMEALAAEADAGGDHPTAARIRAALYDETEEQE
jgi:hypothetical protein